MGVREGARHGSNPVIVYERALVPEAARGLREMVEQAGITARCVSNGAADWPFRRGEVGAAILSFKSGPALDRRVDRIREHSTAGVVVVHDEPCLQIWVRALRAGAHAVVSSRAPAANYLRAALSAMRGESLIPTSVLRMAVARPTGQKMPPLTDSQRELLTSLLSPLTHQAIAQSLDYSVRTLHRRCSALYETLGVQTRAEATAIAARLGFPDDS